MIRALPALRPVTLLHSRRIFAEVKIELLGRNWGFTEGPAWSKDGYLIFSDTSGDRLLKWVPGDQDRGLPHRRARPERQRLR